MRQNKSWMAFASVLLAGGAYTAAAHSVCAGTSLILLGAIVALFCLIIEN